MALQAIPHQHARRRPSWLSPEACQLSMEADLRLQAGKARITASLRLPPCAAGGCSGTTTQVPRTCSRAARSHSSAAACGCWRKPASTYCSLAAHVQEPSPGRYL